VPAGKRLGIESTNGTITLPHGQVPLAVSLPVTTGGFPIVLYIEGLSFHKNVSGVDCYYFESTSRAYLDPGSFPAFSFDRSPDSVGSATFNVTVSGHPEDIQ